MRSAWLQLTQAPVQATLQQTPSAQKPLSHWSALLQGEPGGRLPQAAPVQQAPSWQKPVAHSLSQSHSSPADFKVAGGGGQVGPGLGVGAGVRRCAVGIAPGAVRRRVPRSAA